MLSDFDKLLSDYNVYLLLLVQDTSETIKKEVI